MQLEGAVRVDGAEARRRVDLSLTDITTLDHASALDVLRIRNEDAVRKNMYTDHMIQQEEHFGWIERLKSSKDTVFYAVTYEGAIVGGVSITAINRLHKRADWAFYLSAGCQGKGIGSALERQFVTKAFNDFGIEKLNCEVISFNERVVAMHEHFGFVREGVRRDHVIRDGVKYDAILLGVTKSEWEAAIEPIPRRYHRPNPVSSAEKQ